MEIFDAKSFFQDKLGGVNGIVFSIYLYIVISLNWNYMHSPIGIFLFIIILFCSPILLKFIRKIQIARPNATQKDLLKWGVWAGIISLIILLAWYLAFYPGAYSIDGVYQYAEAISGKYSDWHPVLHTLLFIALPLKLTGGWGGAIVLWQILLFAITIGYISSTCFELGGKVFSIVVTILILVNINTGIVSVYVWKDGSFAMASAVAMIFAIRIFLSEGKWADSFVHCILLAVMLCLSAILRHNGILFALPLLIALAFCMKKKNYIKLLILAIGLFVLIKVPLYRVLDVSEPGGRHTESVGLPLSIIGGCIADDPDRLDGDIQDFAYSIASKEDWETHYESGSFNSIKFELADTSVIEETSIPTILKYAAGCFISNPKTAIKTAIDATSMVYAVGGSIGDTKATNPANTTAPFETSYSGCSVLRYLLNILVGIEAYTSISLIFGYIGNTLLVVILFVCAFCNFKSWEDWKKIFLCLPLFIYAFGTMLLLTGFDWRFFYVNYLVYPLLILLLISKKTSDMNVTEDGLVNKTDSQN